MVYNNISSLVLGKHHRHLRGIYIKLKFFLKLSFLLFILFNLYFNYSRILQGLNILSATIRAVPLPFFKQLLYSCFVLRSLKIAGHFGCPCKTSQTKFLTFVRSLNNKLVILSTCFNFNFNQLSSQFDWSIRVEKNFM